MYRVLILIGMILLGTGILVGQEDLPVIRVGEAINGIINNEITRIAYSFISRRDEALTIQLRATNGDLDPVLTILDENNDLILLRDDAQGTENIETTLSAKRNMLYTIVVTRFGNQVGTTIGEFELLLDRAEGGGNQIQRRLDYGDAVLNTISSDNPRIFYTFEALEGDIIDISMIRNSGNLDPYLQLVNQEAFLLAENDDIPERGTQNAFIEQLVIEQTGIYVIIASRYGQAVGDSVGSFVLTLEENALSGLGKSSLAPARLDFDQTINNNIDDETYERFYRLRAQKDDIISLTMQRVAGTLDSYLILADENLNPLMENDDDGISQNSEIDRFRIPADGRYFIIATRFEGQAGTSVGEYALALERNGTAYEGIPPDFERLEYDTPVIGRIDDVVPEVLYVFWGNAGEAIQLTMNRLEGNVDSLMLVLDDAQLTLVQDDDSGGDKNAFIPRYVLPYTGIYYIRATRFSGTDGDPNTTGNYRLFLTRTE